MRKAGEISAAAHVRAMQECQPGRYEYHLEAAIQHTFAEHGARFPAYNSIVGSGQTRVLHYTENASKMRAGDLVLIDAGCEYQAATPQTSHAPFRSVGSSLLSSVRSMTWCLRRSKQPSPKFGRVIRGTNPTMRPFV